MPTLQELAFSNRRRIVELENRLDLIEAAQQPAEQPADPRAVCTLAVISGKPEYGEVVLAIFGETADYDARWMVGYLGNGGGFYRIGSGLVGSVDNVLAYAKLPDIANLDALAKH